MKDGNPYPTRRVHIRVISTLLATASSFGSWIAYAVEVPTENPTADTRHYGAVDTERLRHADQEPEQWMTGGRDYRAGFFSPLTQINATNLASLGFAWEFKTGTYRGLEATPLVVDGVMYASGNWGVVYALDATTGAKLWAFDPKSDGQAARNGAEDAVSRGVSVWKGRVYSVSMDCRLFALDAKSGRQVFVVDTLTDHAAPYSCTGAPKVAGNVVVVGNGGADNGRGGVRGYVSAYDVASGTLKWRFFTVPALSEPNPTSEMKAAAQTWDPARDPTYGGGGTVWNAMTYDPDLDLLYFGTGNAAPYHAKHNWKDHSTDNLYAASIVALHATTGSMAWYYQATPGDMWDFDATSPLILADLTIDKRLRKTVLQANKNGYFYVLDRQNGQPISATPYSYQNWSSGMDANFRPRINGNADYRTAPKLIYPGANGAHDWEPMSYSPVTGLVYMSVFDAPTIDVDLTAKADAAVRYIDGATGTAVIGLDQSYNPADYASTLGALPKFPTTSAQTGKSVVRNFLKAWDPIQRRVIWERQISEGYAVLEGGTLSTAANIVFLGEADGKLTAFAADTGKVLKVLETGTAMHAAPMTYSVNGTQYVSIMQGFGVGATYLGTAALKYQNEGRILTFKLGGARDIPKPPLQPVIPLREPPAQKATQAQITEGEKLFTTWCSRCHMLGVPAATPDLSRLNDGIDNVEVFETIVLRGAMVPLGMGRFNDVLTVKDAEAIHAYLVDQSWKSYRSQSHDPSKGR